MVRSGLEFMPPRLSVLSLKRQYNVCFDSEIKQTIDLPQLNKMAELLQ